MRNFYTIYILLSIFCIRHNYGQENSLDDLHKPYQTALNVLFNSKVITQQDSLLIAQEKSTVKQNYFLIADSLKEDASPKTYVHFEAQRHINIINFAKNEEIRNKHLDTLYHLSANNQNYLLNDDYQLNKIAQCLMSLRNDNIRSQLKLAQYKAQFVSDFYKKINTSDWNIKKQREFISIFAAQYANKSNISMAEKLYRQFDSLLVEEKQSDSITKISLPETLAMQNAYLIQIQKRWRDFSKRKIVIRPKGQSLFELVYIVSILRIYDKAYRPYYDAFVIRDKENITDYFILTIKSNLAFEDYYIANYSDYDSLEDNTKLPAFMLLDIHDQIIYQTNNGIKFLKKITEPIQKTDTSYFHITEKKRQLRYLKHDSLASLPVDKTKKYRFNHKNMTFTLRGNWQKSLHSKLKPLRWSKNDKVPPSKPYLAQLRIMYSKYTVYQLTVLVTKKKQHITITADPLSQKSIKFNKEKNAQFHKVIQTINNTINKKREYDNILKNYPFEHTSFLEKIEEKKTESTKRRMNAIDNVKNREIKKVLKQYEAKIMELNMRMM